MIKVKELKVIENGKIYTFPYVGYIDENGQDFFLKEIMMLYNRL